MTCPQQSAYEYAESLLPFTNSDACYFVLHNPTLCNSSSWQNIPSVSLDSSLNITIIDADTLQLMWEGANIHPLKPNLPNQIVPPDFPSIGNEINNLAQNVFAIQSSNGFGPGDIATGQWINNVITSAPVAIQESLANVDSFFQLILGPFGW